MKLEIRNVVDRGTTKERIVFTVNENCDIGKYFVFSTEKIKGNEFSSSLEHTYWFPDQKVNKGDLVVLYSKSGEKSFKKNSDETTTYFYYRGFDNSILENFIVLLVEANTWNIEKNK